MSQIDRAGFKRWLSDNGCNNDKVIGDTVSRADRVRRAFEEIDPDFSYEREIAKDGGQKLWGMISRRGASIDQDISLPIGSNQMDSISSAAKKYIQFLREQKNQ